MKVLDEYALTKLGKLENQPLLPQVVTIQRAIRSFLIRTRLTRCVRDGMKMIKAVKAMQRYANQAPYQHFFAEYDEMFGERIEHDLLVKEKKAER